MPDPSIIISGCGGGYDSYLGVPLFHEYADKGYAPIVVNLSFEKKHTLDGYARRGIVDRLTSVCYRVCASKVLAVINCYFPEYYLSRGIDWPVYIIHNGGTIGDIIAAYKAIIKHSGAARPEKIFVMEGGCDAILSGREKKLGTPTEDMMHLRAVSQLPVAEKYVCAIGMNIDTAHGVIYADLVARIAQLAHDGALLRRDVWSLSKASVRKYRDLLQASRPADSIVNSLVVAALDGARGYYTPEHLKARIGRSDVAITELTRTMHVFDLNLLIGSMAYIGRLSNDMSYAQVERFIRVQILGGC